MFPSSLCKEHYKGGMDVELLFKYVYSMSVCSLELHRGKKKKRIFLSMRQIMRFPATVMRTMSIKNDHLLTATKLHNRELSLLTVSFPDCFCACFEVKIYELLFVSLEISLNCYASCKAACQMQEMWARILNFAMSAKNYFKFSSTSLCVSACCGSVVSINNQLFDVRIRY